MTTPLSLTCRQFTVQATDYLEDRLGVFARVQVWLHLSWCRRCRAYLRQLRMTIATLGRLPRQGPPDGVRGDLVRRFRERHGRRPGP
jgi:hypothetical protein